MVSCAVTCGEHAGQRWQKSDWYVWACGKILRSQQGFSHTRSTHLIWSILSSHTRAWMMEKHTIKPEKNPQCFHLNINNQHCTANTQIQFPFSRSSKTEKEHNNFNLWSFMCSLRLATDWMNYAGYGVGEGQIVPASQNASLSRKAQRDFFFLFYFYGLNSNC